MTHVVSVERDISEDRRLREQLIHSERLSAVGQLVAGVAHEINNPLQAVMGFTELLIGADTNPEMRSDLEQIRSDADRAAKIVRHLLLFARRSTLERAVADLNEIARSTCALRAYELKMGSVEHRRGLFAGLPVVVVEPRRDPAGDPEPADERRARAARPGPRRAYSHRDRADRRHGVHRDCRQRSGRRRTPRSAASSSRSSPPRESGRAPASGLSVSLGIAQAHSGSLELLPSDVGACFRLTLPAANDMRINLALPTSV